MNDEQLIISVSKNSAELPEYMPLVGCCFSVYIFIRKKAIILCVQQNAGNVCDTYPSTKKPDNVRLLFAITRIITRKKGWIMIYKDWLVDWLTNYVRPSTKEKTYSRYADVVYQHLIPKLGDYELQELTPLIVQRYITELLQNGNLKTGQGLSANSVNSIITVIQGSMATAHLLELTDRYEMDKLKRPKAKEKPIECFTPTEQKQIEQAVMSDKREKMKGIILCLYTGLRIGELLALEWSDIDFGKAELTVSKTCHDGKNKDGVFCRITDTPKTSHSRRVIPLPKQILPFLREMKMHSTSQFVVSGEKDAILSVRSYQRSFELIQKKLGIPRRGFHALRHTFATRAIECGMDIKSLSEILGHKNPMITLNRYVHSLMDHKRAMMDKLGKIL